MQRVLCNIGVLGVFVLGAGAMQQVIVHAPAFNTALHQDNAFGDSVVLLGRDMYDTPAYLYQQAASFVRADLVPFDAEGDQTIAPLEVAEERAAQAVTLARESLSLDPGNAGGWMVLAWAHLMHGDADPARDALRASWSLAPYSFALAEERISISLTLFDPALYGSDAPVLTDADRAGLRKDFETLWVQRRAFYAPLSAEAKALGLPVYAPPADAQE